MKQVGRELGVRYVLEGSVRKAGNRVRVTAQLIEAETGNHVWAERYDRDLADIFAVQDEITEAVTIAIAPAIADAEQRAMRKPPGSLDAWAAYQRGLWHLSKANPDDNTLAENSFGRPSISTRPSPEVTKLWRRPAITPGPYTKHAIRSKQRRRRKRSRDGRLNWTVPMRRLEPASGWHCGCAVIMEGALAELERALTISPNLAAGQRNSRRDADLFGSAVRWPTRNDSSKSGFANSW